MRVWGRSRRRPRPEGPSLTAEANRRRIFTRPQLQGFGCSLVPNFAALTDGPGTWQAVLAQRGTHGYAGQTALSTAVRAGQFDAMEAMVGEGADLCVPVDDDTSALELLVQQACLGVKGALTHLFQILDRLANHPDFCCFDVNAPIRGARRFRNLGRVSSGPADSGGAGEGDGKACATVMGTAAAAPAAGRGTVIKVLLAAGARVTVDDLSRAIDGMRMNNGEAAAGMVAFGALLRAVDDVNAVTSRGSTPLHDAAASGSVQAVMALLKRKADPEARDREGQTPLQVAERWERAEAAEVLRRQAEGRLVLDRSESRSGSALD